MVIARHSLDVPRIETTEFRPISAQVEEAVMAMRGLRQLIRHGDPNKLSSEVRKSLSAFSFGANSFASSPVQSDRTLSCLVDSSDLSCLVDNVAISGPVVAVSDRQRANGAGFVELRIKLLRQ
jgi:hypothetical protein